MDEQLIEIKDYMGVGYSQLVSYDQWRVAALRFLDELLPENMATMERHLKTDEVFILMRGRGMLLLGGNSQKPGNIQSIIMEIGRVYNIKKYTWHTISLTKNAHVIIVENDDTDASNSEIQPMSENDRLYTKEIVNKFLKEAFEIKENKNV